MHGGVSCRPSCTFDVYIAVRTTGENVRRYITKRYFQSLVLLVRCCVHHESTPQIIDLRQKKAFPTSNSCKLQPLFIKPKEVPKKETFQNSEQTKTQQKKPRYLQIPGRFSPLAPRASPTKALSLGPQEAPNALVQLADLSQLPTHLGRWKIIAWSKKSEGRTEAVKKCK